MRTNWYEIFAASAAAEPERVAVREGARSVTFAELKALETALAGRIAAWRTC